MPATSGASASANPSARCIARRFALSSPMTIEKYEITTVITTSARGCATDAGIPHPIKTGESPSARVAPPKAADRKPDRVTPICTADRNRLGLLVSRSIARPRFPLDASCLICDSRKVTKAISAAANVPPIRMKSAMSAISETADISGRSPSCSHPSAPGVQRTGAPPRPGSRIPGLGPC